MGDLFRGKINFAGLLMVTELSSAAAVFGVGFKERGGSCSVN